MGIIYFEGSAPTFFEIVQVNVWPHINIREDYRMCIGEKWSVS
jgi:hypothetical protein